MSSLMNDEIPLEIESVCTNSENGENLNSDYYNYYKNKDELAK